MSPKDELTIFMKSLAQQVVVRTEYIFDDVRKFRFDWAIPELKIAIEYNGHHVAGRTGAKVSGHSSITGISNDAEKGNLAGMQGWIVLRFTALHFNRGSRKKHKLSDPWLTLMETIGIRTNEKNNLR